MKRFITSLVFCAVLFTALSSGCGNGSSKDKGDARTDGGNQDSGVELCTGDTACSDGKFCNGVERCNPGAKGADARGCVVASKGPCDDGQSCEENRKKCIACRENADVDGDGHDAINCGGDDCDDNDPNRYPGNVEVCDNKNHDEDCDPTTFGNKDSDGDGNIDAVCCNTGLDGKKHCGDDCDDAEPAVHPGQVEVCDGKDNNCDGKTDETQNVVNWYQDKDGDGFGGKTVVKQSCQIIQGASLLNTDCEDSDAAIHPGADEKCDKIDNNCDSQTDEAYECTSCGALDNVKACLCTGRVLGVRTCQPNGSWADCDCSVHAGSTSGKDGAGGGGSSGGSGGKVGGASGTGAAGGDGGNGTLSSNANLASLTVSQGTLTPAFDANKLSYSISVTNEITSMTVTPTAVDANATIKVNGAVVASGVLSGDIALNLGLNIVNIVVTAQNIGTVKTYKVAIMRSVEDCRAEILFGVTVPCSIATQGEMDTYKLLANTNDTIFVRVSSSGTSYPHPSVRILSPDGTKVCEVITTSNPSNSKSAEIPSCNLPTSGTYTILVYENEGIYTWKYGLYIQRLNHAENADEIQFGETISTSIKYETKIVDSYSFSAYANDTILARIGSSGTSYPHPAVRIFNPDGTKVCEVITTNNPSNSKSAEIPSCNLLTSGTHTILVNDDDGRYSWNYGLYLQKLNK